MNRLETAKTTFQRRLRLAIAASVSCLLCAGATPLAGTAHASSSAIAKITSTCEAERLPSGYTEQEYHEALQHLSAYAVEYTRCQELIVDAERSGARGGGGSTTRSGGHGAGAAGNGTTKGGTPPSGESSIPPATAEEQQEIAQAQTKAPASVTLGGGDGAGVHPGVIHADVASAFKSMPDALIAALAAIAALIVVLLGRAARERMRLVDEED